MGQSFDGDSGSKSNAIARGVLNATAGGLNAASGTTPQPPPVDFSGIGSAIKKARGPKPVSLNNPTTSAIPQPGPLGTPPIFSMNDPIGSPISNSPMPDLYSGSNAQIPQLRKPINGMLPFYGR